MRRKSSPRSAAATLGWVAVTLFGFGLATGPAHVGFAADGQPAKKDSNIRIRPKEVVATPSVSPKEAKPGDTVTYQVAFKLEPGWHIYKYDKVAFGEGLGPRNTTFDFFDTQGLKIVGEWTPKKPPIEKQEPFFDNQVIAFYEDEATWSVKLQIPSDVKPGKKVLRCQAGYQICDDKSCKQPGQWTVQDVELTVLPGDGASSAKPGTEGAEAKEAAAPPSSTNEPTAATPRVAQTSQAEGKSETAAAPHAVGDSPIASLAKAAASTTEPAPSPAPAGDSSAKESNASKTPTDVAASAPVSSPAPAPASESSSAKESNTSSAPAAVAASTPASSSTSAPASESTSAKGSTATSAAKSATTAPVSEVAREAQRGLIPFLLFSAGGGLLALVMPCVWPMVPITVNFFVKQGHHNKGKTTGLAIAYCLAIIGVFTTFGVLVSFFFSATALQNLANNPWLNAVVALLFIAFGLSLLGLFEIRLPNFLLNASARGESRGGFVGVMFMALTLTITSFTCTFPVVGGLIVMAAGGQFFYPILGLATFSAVLAFPFFLLALAPGLMAKMPKSGDWMNAVKVVGGLIELGAALKFINTAELGFGTVPEDAWFDAPLVLSVWIGLSAVCGAYLLGLFRTDHDHEEVKIGPGRLVTGSLFFALALFLTPALFGHPPKSPFWDLLVGILPPDVKDLEARSTAVAVAGSGGTGEKEASSADPEQAEREQKSLHGVVWGMSFDAAREQAKAIGKPVLIDFTGVNCVNCRKMEQTVMPRREVIDLLSQFVTVQLYTDIVPIRSIKKDDRYQLAERNQNRLLELANETTNPFYVVLGADGQVLAAQGGYIFPNQFTKFLQNALDKYGSTKSQTKGNVALGPVVVPNQ